MKLLPENILVVKNRALGDSIIGLSSISYLKKMLPNSKITYGVPKWIIPVYERCMPNADRLLSLDFSSLTGIFNLFRRLRKNKYDLIIELHQTGRTSKIFKMFSLIFRIKYIYHNHNLKNGSYIIDQGITKPSIQRDLDCCFSALTNYLKMNITPPKYLEHTPQLKSGISDKENQITLGVIATRKSKMWPLKYFKELIDLILNEFSDYTIVIPLSKNKMDQEIKKQLLELDLNDHIKIVEVTLEKLPEIISKSKLYVGNDTGLKHLSIALESKTITFFGPEEPLEWHPYDRKDHKFFFCENLKCRTIAAHYCGLFNCNDHLCLEKITPKTIFNAVQIFLKS